MPLNDEYSWRNITTIYNLLMYCTFTLFTWVCLFSAGIYVQSSEGKFIFLLLLYFLHYCMYLITLVTSYFADCQAITYSNRCGLGIE